MSFWSSLFGGNAQERHVEREIRTQIVQDLIDGGMSTGDATSLVRSCIDAAKEEIRKEGTQRLPPSYGDVLLQHEKTDSNVAKELAKKRREGVTDEDIQRYRDHTDYLHLKEPAHNERGLALSVRCCQ